jgi:glyoxylase-like metal-dependent hydrolase (beta-lactamase superfamily II)
LPLAVPTPLDAPLAPPLRVGAHDSGYEVLALRYGTWSTTRAYCFGDRGPADDGERLQQMDYFFWVIHNDHRTVVVDTGFAPDVGQRRQRTCLAAPVDLLAAAGVDPEHVEHLVITHLHYDHIGNIAAFPRASIHLHRRELEFWRSRAASDGELAGLAEPAELATVESAMRAGRITVIDEDAALFTGVTAIWTGGHAPGQLIVTVQSAGSLVVLASDALHFYEELSGPARFAVFTDAEETEAGYELLRELSRRGAVVVPGHDPVVMERFPRLPGELADLGVKLA